MSNVSFLDCDEILSHYPPPPPPLSHVGWSISLAMIVLFSALTLAGNSLVILLVIKYRKLRVRTNAFIVSVAFADIGVAVFVMPFRLYEEWNKGWDLGRWFCLIVNLMDAIFCTVSMSNLYCLGFERYLAVCHPFVHERITVTITALMISATWILPLVGWMVPFLNLWHIRGIEALVMCATEGACPFILNIPLTIIADVPGFFLPTLFIIFCYMQIFLAARRHTHRIVDLNMSESECREMQKMKKTLKAALVLGIVIGSFCVCWFPFFIVVFTDPFINYQIPIKIKLIVTWLGYFNSMINPILYYLLNQQFRRAYKAVLCCRKMENDQMVAATNTSSHP